VSPLLLDSSRGAILQELSPFPSLPPSLSSFLFFSPTNRALTPFSISFASNSPRHGPRLCLPQSQYLPRRLDGQHHRNWLGRRYNSAQLLFYSISGPFLLKLLIQTSFNCPNHRLGDRIRQAVWSIIFKRSSAGLQRSHQHGTRSSQCAGPSE
jgi:hypothetical protein